MSYLCEPDEKSNTVKCEQKCGAPANPQTPEEYKLAYEHWRYHSCLSGCSHGD